MEHKPQGVQFYCAPFRLAWVLLPVVKFFHGAYFMKEVVRMLKILYLIFYSIPNMTVTLTASGITTR